MRLRVPYYYKDFSCIADKCKNSCCVGWEIDIDEDTFDYYKSVPGAFGKRLKENMAKDEENSFILKDGRCPFLNKKNLCDICIELGETSLCEICTEYPRFTMEYGDTVEKCLGLSCEAAGRIVFKDDTRFSVEETEIPDMYDYDMNADDFDYDTDDNDTDDFAWNEMEASDEGSDTYLEVEAARNFAIWLLQMRELSLAERIEHYLHFSEDVQQKLNERKEQEIEELIHIYKKLCKGASEGENENPSRKKEDDAIAELSYQACKKRLEVYEKLELLDEEWPKALAHTKQVLTKEHTLEQYAALQKEFQSFYADRMYEWEQLLVYFTFRYFMKSVYDSRFLPQAQYAVVSFLMIRDMDMVRFLDLNGTYSKEDRVDVARIYSKEVEHSQENLELLGEECDFEKMFSVEQLIMQVEMMK